MTHGFVVRAQVERQARLPVGLVSPERFDNTSVTVLHEAAPHGVTLLNCTRHLLATVEIDPAGGAA